eukprot:1183741-Prorocentrum_minimum.AAC.8
MMIGRLRRRDGATSAGPGLFEIGGERINQPFDGDGMIHQLSFKEGRVYFRNKFVRAKGYVHSTRQEQVCAHEGVRARATGSVPPVARCAAMHPDPL